MLTHEMVLACVDDDFQKSKKNLSLAKFQVFGVVVFFLLLLFVLFFFQVG